MLRKFLFVGLGGSGGKTLRYLRRDLQSWLDSNGWQGEFPSAWQMIHIDTPTAQDGGELEVAPLPASDYLGLVNQGIDFRTVSNKVVNASPEDGWRDLAGWRVDPTYLTVPITTGAGQFRAVGRTIGLAYADRILESMRGRWNRLSSATAGAELAEIHQKVYREQAHTPTDPVVVVVSSLAGGTGAGLLLDVCDLIRQLPGSASDSIFGILYVSDVFNELGDMATQGVQPNALAALSELMNGYWLTQNYARASGLFSAAGAATPISRSGPSFPFLVGASNTQGVTFGNQVEVYAMMGSALRGWATDPVIQEKLVEYTTANWQNNAAGNVVKAETLMRDHQPVFEAFGYAEVQLGTDRFGRYAQERLARSAADWLLRGHETRALQRDPDDSREPTEIAEDFARDELVHFLREVRLHERGENDQVIDDLEPFDADQLLASVFTDVQEQVLPGAKAMPSGNWIARIAEVIPGHAEDHMRRYDEQLRARAQAWVERMPDLVVKALSEVISRHGLDVAYALLGLVIDEIEMVAQELGEEMNELLRWSVDFRSAIASCLSISGNIPATHTAIHDAIWQGVDTKSGFGGQAKRREMARALLRQLATDVLEPLRMSVGHARSGLHHKGVVGDGMHEPPVPSWSNGAVPTSLRPPQNEFLVIDGDEFLARFDELLRRSTRSELAAEHLPEARSAVITGSFLDPEDRMPSAQPGIEISGTWMPDSLLVGSSLPRTPATFSIGFDPDDLLDRAKAWMHRPGSAFARFLDLDLRDYLDDDAQTDPAETARRRASFRQALTSALAAAEPLVRLDAGMLSLLHNEARIPQRAVPSTLPFHGHPIEGEVREILAHSLGGSTGSSLDAYFTTKARVRSISISSTLGAAHDPLVFSSIMDPIVRGWNAAKQSPQARTSFWSSRRARPLEEFVPASHEILLAMTRGWFTGMLLGSLDRQNRCIVRADKSVASFPQPLLREVPDGRDVLPAVLESLGLAYAEVANHKTLESLSAYIELRDLGMQPAVSNFQAAHIYNTVNERIERWIRTGDTGPRLAKPVVESTAERDLSTATPAERRDAAIRTFKNAADGYEKLMVEYRDQWQLDPSVLGAEQDMWPGMFSMIQRALHELRAATTNLQLVDMTTVM